MIDVRKKPTRPQRPGVSVLLLALNFAGCQSDAAPAAEGDFWRPPPLTGDATEIPDARAIVRRMTAFMSGHEQVAFEAFVTFGAVQASGQKLHFDLLQRMAIQKPNKLFWVTIHDNATADSAWLDAGKFRMIKQPANAWGEVDLPPALPDAIDRLVHEYDLDVPFADILSGDPTELWLGADVVSVEYVGEAWVEGAWTDHVAIRKDGVDLEIWVQQGDQPFPRRFMVVFTEEQGLPSYSARFRRWATSFPPSALPEFSPPADGERVEIIPVHEW